MSKLNENLGKSLNFDARRPRYRDAEITRDLQRFKVHAEELLNNSEKKHIIGKDYDNWYRNNEGLVSYATLTRQFGSFQKVCESLQLRVKKVHEYNIEQLRDHLKNVWRWVGYKPTMKNLADYNEEFGGTTIVSKTYTDRWGNWSNTLKLFENHFSLPADYPISYLEQNMLKNNKNKREAISPKLRAKILDRDGYKCCDCGAKPEPGNDVKLEIHHKKPVKNSDGQTEGLNDEENLQALCQTCNRGRSNKILSKP